MAFCVCLTRLAVRFDEVATMQVRQLPGVVYDRADAERRPHPRRSFDEALVDGITGEQARTDAGRSRIEIMSVRLPRESPLAVA